MDSVPDRPEGFHGGTQAGRRRGHEPDKGVSDIQVRDDRERAGHDGKGQRTLGVDPQPVGQESREGEREGRVTDHHVFAPRCSATIRCS